jgi:hypothetical protein
VNVPERPQLSPACFRGRCIRSSQTVPSPIRGRSGRGRSYEKIVELQCGGRSVFEGS